MNILKGILAGIIATIVLSIMMVIKAKMQVMPELNIIAMLSQQMDGSMQMGWIMHFVIGAGYGVLMALLFNKIPFNCGLKKGMVLGLLGWLMMMVVIMPMMGQGLFAVNMGMMAPVMTLILHLIFGMVLGASYQKMIATSAK
ncbi:hypothetical protein JCM30760_07560 [Thiomicrorhabdus hydrogeniphila]